MTFLQGFRFTWRSVLTDKGALLLLLVAGVVYSFFYPLPYKHETLSEVPLIVVDLDASASSRQLVRLTAAAPRLTLTAVVDDPATAQAALWREEAAGVLIIPAGFHRAILRGDSATVQVAGHGGYLLSNSAVLTGVSQAALTMSAQIKTQRLQAQGVAPAQAAEQRQPVRLESVPLYNPNEGYGSYVVPGVLVMLLQQTLLVGMALVWGSWSEQRLAPRGVGAALGVAAAFASIAFLNALYFFGFVLWYQGYAQVAALADLILFSLLFSLALAAAGLLLCSVFVRRERGLQLLLGTAIPIFFLSGYPWPVEAMPSALQYLRWALPSTAGIQGFVALNQMGAPLAALQREIVALLGLLAVTLPLALWRLRALPSSAAARPAVAS